MAVIRRRAIVEGDVQGVFFRDSTQREAHSRRVAGWVGNRSDGSVEAVFEGETADVEAMIGFCREGSSRAEVESVGVSEEEPEGLSGFEVR